MRRLCQLTAAALLSCPRAAGDESPPAYAGVPITDVMDVEGAGPVEQLPGFGIAVNSTVANIASPTSSQRSTMRTNMETEPEAAPDMFAYHKEFWPLDRMDVITLVLSALGLLIAAGGGIGGGGILVPLFMLSMKFRPKHAIALSNFTILGGSIANTILNVRSTNEMGPLIDWDIVAMMEPSTIAGAVLGSFLSKFLSDFVLTIFLAAVLAMLSYRTLDKGIKMFQRESDDEHKRLEGTSTPPENAEDYRSDDDVNESEQLIGRDGGMPGESPTPWLKIKMLLICLGGCMVLTILKGSGHGSILGIECGSAPFWTISLAPLPWVMLFGAYFRRKLIAQNSGGTQASAVRWDATTTVKYPLVCSIAGIFAGLFGVGGGIVKGPLMLEMGVDPVVAAATAATMILFTTSAACVSFQVFGLLEPRYGVACFVLGLVCTAVGQGATTAWMKAAKRQSPPVLSIGLVMALSTVLVSLEALEEFTYREWDGLFRPTDICSRFE